MKSVLFTIVIIGQLTSFSAQANDALTLRDGLLIDPASALVYVMLPAGGVAAIDLATGASAWESAAADRPLNLDQGLLLAQIDTAVAGRMDLAFLAADSGQLSGNQSLTVDPNIIPIIDENLGSKFELRHYGPAEALMAWQYEHRTVQGMPSSNPPPVTRGAGAFSLDSAAGKVAPVASPDADEMAAIWHNPSLLAINPVAGAKGQQFRSINSAHTLVARHEPDSGRWESWVWSVYGANGALVGSARSFMGFAPFVVIEGRLLYVSQPYTKRLDNGEYEIAPLLLRAVDIKSGKQLWQRAVRDTRYTGPYPM